VSDVFINELGPTNWDRHEIYAKMHLVEQVGSGIVRMKELMKVAGLKAPVFQKEGFFTITLLRPLHLEKPSQFSSLKPSLKTKDNILLLIKQNSKITILELSQLLHKSRRAIELQIKSLKENKLIEEVGLDMIVLDNSKKLMPDTGGLVSDTNQKVSDSIGLVAETFGELNSQTSALMNYLSKNEIITSKDVEKMFEVIEARARRILNELVEKGLIEKHGKARSTFYKKKNN